jgi:hypothetical protein
MTRTTDYAAISKHGRVVQTFDCYESAERFADLNPGVVVHRRTITLTPIDARGRFTAVRQGVRMEVRA